MGMAIASDINTSTTKYSDNNFQIEKTDAPNTLRTPISLVLFSATKDASPNIPRQLIKIANVAKKAASELIRSSLANFFPYCSSTNCQAKGLSGLYFLNTSFNR